MSGIKLACYDCGQGNRVPVDKLSSAPKCGTCGSRLVDGKVHEVDPAWLSKAKKTDDLPLVVDFWAPWCGPCKMMAPEFSKAASQLEGMARLVKLNTEDHPKASQTYGIRGIPMLAVFKSGKELARKAGAMPMAGIVAFVGQAK